MLKKTNSGTYLVSAILLIALLIRVGYMISYDELFDDAFITFRFAQNILTTGQFAYNSGEIVYGASSPLYTFIMAGFSAICNKDILPTVSRGFGIACFLGCALLFYRYLPLTFIPRICFLIFFLSYPRIFYSSVGGMEEPFILILMALSVVSIVKSSAVLLGITAGLLFITKSDTMVWILSLFIIARLKQQRSLLLSLGIAFIVALPWNLYSFATFDSIFPHTITAKQVAYSQGLTMQLVDIVLLAVPDGLRNNLLWVVLFSALWYGTLFLSLWRSWALRDWIYFLFPLYCSGYTVALFLSGTTLGLWSRWTIPLLTSLIICLCFLLHEFFTRYKFDSYLRLNSRTMFVVIGITIIFDLSPILYPNRSLLALNSHREMALWLRDHSTTGESIMLEPIGLVGYISRLYVHDFIGLVSPDVTKSRIEHQRSNRWFAHYLKKHTPTYVMLRNNEVQTNNFSYGDYGDKIFTDEELSWFHSHYKQVYQTTVGPPVDWFVLFKRQTVENK